MKRELRATSKHVYTKKRAIAFYAVCAMVIVAAAAWNAEAQWVEPSSSPTAGNVALPIFTQGVGQSISAGLQALEETYSHSALSGEGSEVGIQGNSARNAFFAELLSDGFGGPLDPTLGSALYLSVGEADDYALHLQGGLGIGLGTATANPNKSVDIRFESRDSGIAWPRVLDEAYVYGLAVTNDGSTHLYGHGGGIQFLDQNANTRVSVAGGERAGAGGIGIGTAAPDGGLALSGGSLFVSPTNQSLAEVGALVNGGGSAPYIDNAQDIELLGDFAYITSFNDGALSIINIKNPSLPVAIGALQSANLDGAVGIDVAGRYAYVASNIAERLTVIDISNPSVPQEITSVSAKDAAHVYVSGEYAYVSGSNSTGHGSLLVYHIADPADPVLVGEYPLCSGVQACGVWNFALEGNYAYMASIDDGNFTIIDISHPHAPRRAGTFLTPFTSAWNVAVSGGYAYVTSIGNDLIAAIDVSDPANPALAGTLADDSAGGSATALRGPGQIALAGDYALVAADTDSAVSLVRITDPSNLQEAGVLFDDSAGGTAHNLLNAWGLELSGNRAYVVTFSGALSVIDISGVRSAALDTESLSGTALAVSDTAVADTLEAHSVAIGSGGLESDGMLTVSGPDERALVLEWTFDICNTSCATVWDTSPNVYNNISLYGGLGSRVAGKVGNALSFDGSDDVILADVGHVEFGNGAYTFAFWINPDSMASTPAVVHMLDASDAAVLTISIAADGSLEIEDSAGATKRTANVITAGAWQHVAVAIDPASGNASFSVDGEAEPNSEANDALSINTAIARMVVGAKFSGYVAVAATPPYDSLIGGPIILTISGSNYFDGLLDDMRAYTGFMNAAQIQELYRAGGSENHIGEGLRVKTASPLSASGDMELHGVVRADAYCIGETCASSWAPYNFECAGSNPAGCFAPYSSYYVSVPSSGTAICAEGFVMTGVVINSSGNEFLRCGRMY